MTASTGWEAYCMDSAADAFFSVDGHLHRLLFPLNMRRLTRLKYKGIMISVVSVLG